MRKVLIIKLFGKSFILGFGNNEKELAANLFKKAYNL